MVALQGCGGSSGRKPADFWRPVDRRRSVRRCVEAPGAVFPVVPLLPLELLLLLLLLFVFCLAKRRRRVTPRTGDAGGDVRRVEMPVRCPAAGASLVRCRLTRSTGRRRGGACLRRRLLPGGVLGCRRGCC